MEALKAALARKLQGAQKELGRGLDAPGRRDGEDAAAPTAEQLAYAVYDNDARSRQNQMVKKIDESDKLDEPEKEALLASHQKGVSELEGLMDAERKKQEKDLEAMLKGRLDRRKKRAEKTKSATNDEESEAARAIAAEVAAEARLKAEQVEREAEEKLRQAKKNQEGIERAQ